MQPYVHKPLRYRHPLVHYKSSSTKIRGSYSVYKIRTWLDNVENEQALQNLHDQMDEILKFVNTEMKACHTAFEQLVLLCESLTFKASLVQFAVKPQTNKFEAWLDSALDELRVIQRKVFGWFARKNIH